MPVSAPHSTTLSTRRLALHQRRMRIMAVNDNLNVLGIQTNLDDLLSNNDLLSGNTDNTDNSDNSTHDTDLLSGNTDNSVDTDVELDNSGNTDNSVDTDVRSSTTRSTTTRTTGRRTRRLLQRPVGQRPGQRRRLVQRGQLEPDSINDSFQDRSIHIKDSYNESRSTRACASTTPGSTTSTSSTTVKAAAAGPASRCRRRRRLRARDRHPLDEQRPVGQPEHLDVLGQRRRSLRGRRRR